MSDATSGRALTAAYGNAAIPAGVDWPVLDNVVCLAGTIAVSDGNGYVRGGLTGTGYVCLGRFNATVDNTAAGPAGAAHASGALRASVAQGVFPWNNSTAGDAITIANRGQICYIVDNQTVALTDGGGTRSIAGIIYGVASATSSPAGNSTYYAGQVFVQMGVYVQTIASNLAGALTPSGVQSVTGAKTFGDNTLVLNNSGGTFATTFHSSATAARSFTFPDVASATAIVDAGTQTISGVKTFSAAPVFAKEADYTVNVVTTTTAATVGGALTIAAGQGATSGAGGAFAGVGGAGGLTGAGGAALLTGGAGGATSGVGGAATIAGGAGTNGNSAGGVASITGGAGQGSAAGGVGKVVGGLAGATGTGGAAQVTGGAGGATSGVGGAAQVAGGAGTAGNSAGGVASLTGGAGQGSAAGGAANHVGGVGGATGAGGAAAVTGGAGGATSGTGGAVAITGGAGSAGNASGGAVTIDGGALNGSGVNGAVTIGGTNASVITIGKAGGSISLGDGTVTQGTSVSTAVTLNASSGVITTFSQSAAAGAVSTFTVNNSCCLSTSVVVASIGNYAGTFGTNGFPLVTVSTVSAGSFAITIVNTAPSNALSGALKIHFAVI